VEGGRGPYSRKTCLETMAESAPPTAPDAVPPPRPSSERPVYDEGDYKAAFKTRKVITELVDPCEEHRRRSMKCLDVNNYDRTMCSDAFKAFRECKGKWLNQRREDRRNGLL